MSELEAALVIVAQAQREGVSSVDRSIFERAKALLNERYREAVRALRDSAAPTGSGNT